MEQLAQTSVADWATDYDYFDAGFGANPYPTWSDLRDRCPIAHTDRWGGSFMPTRYEDVRAIAYDTETFSSSKVSVADVPENPDGIKAPPITSDPPEHTWARRILLPMFAPKRVDAWEQYTRGYCNELIDGVVASGRADAAVDYAQQIPVRVISLMLGVPAEQAPTFTRWVRQLLEFGALDPYGREEARGEMLTFFMGQIERKRVEPGDDIISQLLELRVEGEPVEMTHILGTCFLILLAGIDTTWSSIGSSLWHLATHPADRERLVAEPELIPTAIEEFLRAYSPVTMAREVTREVEYNGVRMCPGDKVLMPFPAGNRDPAVFPDPDSVIIDREQNRHFAFGIGIHRCLGSNLARMELRVAVEEWLKRVPSFRLEDPESVTWSCGQVRGPRSLRVVFG